MASCPATWIVPVDGVTMPQMMLISVVLPAPFGPSSAKISPLLIEMDVLEADAPLAAAIAQLPGRKLVFTNGDKPYALRVLDRLGLGDAFEAVHDIHAMDLVPKPHASAYAGLCAAFAIDPTRAIFFEDMARNLTPAKAIGMTTVWIDNGSEQGPEDARDHIDFTVHDLAPWLQHVMEAS